MKLESKMTAKVIAMSEEESKDGKSIYYRLAVLQGMECGKLTCPEEVYHSVNVGGEFIFNMQFNDEYKSFRIIGIADIVKPDTDTPVPPKQGAAVPPKQGAAAPTAK